MMTDLAMHLRDAAKALSLAAEAIELSAPARETDALLTEKQLSAAISLSTRTLARYRTSGRIPVAAMIGESPRYSLLAVRAALSRPTGVRLLTR